MSVRVRSERYALVSLKIGDVSIVDSFWGPAFVLSAWIYRAFGTDPGLAPPVEFAPAAAPRQDEAAEPERGVRKPLDGAGRSKRISLETRIRRSLRRTRPTLRRRRAECRGEALRWGLDKEFHVSPFLTMEMRYAWTFTPPGDSLVVHMENRPGNATQWRSGRARRPSTPRSICAAAP